MCWWCVYVGLATMNFKDIYDKEENKENRAELRNKIYEVYEAFSKFCTKNEIDVKTFECHFWVNDDLRLSINHTIEKYAPHK